MDSKEAFKKRGDCEEHDNSQTNTKKRKLSDKVEAEEETESAERNDDGDKQNQYAFKDFKLLKVLREDDRHKVINLYGTMPHMKVKGNSETDSDNKGEEKSAVVLLERKPFDPVFVEKYLKFSKTHKTLDNDIYSTFNMFSSQVQPDMKATLIFPATEKHVSKYSEHQPFVVHETPQLYKEVTLPCLEASKFSIQWVYNILDKKQEADRIVSEDPDPETGFVMVPDMKWDRTKVESLYLVAIIHKRNVRSIRDLRKEHIPLLENVLQKGQNAIQGTFGVGVDKLRIYLHYQPSYYHLHIHFTHIKFDAPGTDLLRAHLLSDVIDNLTIDPDFYSKKTLSYVVRDGDELYKWYKEHGQFS